jgi:hypothetical protein
MINNPFKAWEKLPSDLKLILSRHDAFLAGGSILAGIIDGAINDYDLWFPDNSKLVNCFHDLTALGADIEFNSANAWTLKLWNDFKIQCVKKHIGCPDMILRGFDFKFCQFGINCKNQALIYSDLTPEQVLSKTKIVSPFTINNIANRIVARGGVPSFSDFFTEDEKTEMESVINPDYPSGPTADRFLKYFEKNLIHISVESMIAMLVDSNVKIPGWLITKSGKLWNLTGWTKDHIGNLYPPASPETETDSYY